MTDSTRRAALPGALAAAALTALGAAGSAQAAFPGENGRIAFSQLTDADSGGVRIVSVLPDGTGARELTPRGGGAYDPAFSANGRLIAYVDDPGEIYRMRANGRRKVRLTRNRRIDDNPTWSPNNRRIAFVRQTRASREIFTMNRRGRKVRRLTRNRRSESSPAWSPNGRWIAFTRINRRGQPVILKMRPNGRRVRRVTRGAWPAWSPNGKRIAFTRHVRSSADQEILTVRRNGRGLRRLTRDPVVPFRNDLQPTWSPDGRWIAWARHGDLWKMRPNGRDKQAVVAAPSLTEPVSLPTWQAR